MSGNDRNKPCFCGSGLKYKKCHLPLEEKIKNANIYSIEQPEVYEIHKELHEDYKIEMCLAAGLQDLCSKKIINAHTVPRSSSLDTIAIKGHVYTFKNMDFLELNRNNGKIKPKKIGVKTASTFKGFCSYHDDKLFKCLETTSFQATYEQCLMLIYRAFSLEFYNKKVEYSRLHSFNKKILSIKDPLRMERAKFIYEQQAIGLKAALNDANLFQKKLNNIIELNDYFSVKSYAIKVEGLIPFMCAGLFALEENVDGSFLQNLSDNYTEKNPSYISLSIFTDKENINWIVYSWLNEHDEINSKFLNKLDCLDDFEKINVSLNLMIKHLENCYFNIEYWDNLSEEFKELICKRYNNLLLINQWSLKKDKINIPIHNVEVLEIKRN